MPDTLTPPAPSATVREVRIVEAPAPKPPPAPTRTLSPADIAAAPEPSRPGAQPAPESSRASLRKNLEGKAKPIGQGNPEPVPVKPPKPSEKPAEAAPAEQPPGEPETPPAGQPAANLDPATGKPKKANPWSLFNEEKKARATAEAEIQRLKTSIVPEQERTALTDRVTKAEARAKELEDHIRFVSYEKSQEFVDTYQKPYEAAWARATKELSEISIIDPASKQPRAVTSQDILELVNMPLGTAREVADEVFGRFADDVMGHRKEIKSLFDKQGAALEEAKKNGGLRDQQRKEQWQKQQGEMQGFVQKTWKEVEDEFLADPVNGEYFRPKVIAEGQQPTPEEKEWNEAIERGRALVKDAWGRNAMDPKLTPEERREAIKKNKAVELRAIAYGPLKRLTKRLEARVKQLEKDLQQYSESTPGAGGSTPAGQSQQAEGAMSGIVNRLRKLAR